LPEELIMTKRPLCPFLNKACIGDACTMWTQVLGKDPQTGAPINHADCSIKWIPVLLIENSKEQAHTTASLDAHRDEMRKAQENLTAMLAITVLPEAQRERLIRSTSNGNLLLQGASDS
jgi:hypothetical protein